MVSNSELLALLVTTIQTRNKCIPSPKKRASPHYTKVYQVPLHLGATTLVFEPSRFLYEQFNQIIFIIHDQGCLIE